MEIISSYKAKSIDRYIQPVGSVVLIIYALLMSAMSAEMRFFLIVIGAIAIVFGLLNHFHRAYKFYEDFLEMQKTPISSTHRFHYSNIECMEKNGSAKLSIQYRRKGEINNHTLYLGMLSKSDREKITAELESRTSSPSLKE
ncbi:hypothetical protein DU490_09840 [Halomonas sp. DQ26W]|nr:hypothetical protein DU490_09840 [Halomonas sp. DQ26W]